MCYFIRTCCGCFWTQTFLGSSWVSVKVLMSWFYFFRSYSPQKCCQMSFYSPSNFYLSKWVETFFFCQRFTDLLIYFYLFIYFFVIWPVENNTSWGKFLVWKIWRIFFSSLICQTNLFSWISNQWKIISENRNSGEYFSHKVFIWQKVQIYFDWTFF